MGIQHIFILQSLYNNQMDKHFSKMDIFTSDLYKLNLPFCHFKKYFTEPDSNLFKILGGSFGKYHVILSSVSAALS